MKTLCPRCDARLEIDPNDAGQVLRCPDCMLLLLSPELPALPADWQPQDLPSALEPEPLPVPEDETIVLESAEEPSSQPVDRRPAPEAPTTEAAPGPATTTHRPSTAATLVWTFLAAALIALLALQLVIHQRERLAAWPQLRPALTTLCELAGCELAPYRDLQALALLDHHVLAHPVTPGALLIQATIVNRAPLPQTWPLLELRFTDVQGRVVGLRRFRATEYLPDPAAAREPMPADTPIDVELELLDPGADALAYEFDLL
ncbi:MAG: DUF3426 domain-containing protein [Ectothiorhodospiraceae bacterium]|jgi:hypothetical protein|nr:DUF3426 domain-containing protein [Ectothiorhodospiraceae bacterium]